MAVTLPLMHGSTSPAKNGSPSCSHWTCSRTRRTARRASALAGSRPNCLSSIRLHAVEVHSGNRVPRLCGGNERHHLSPASVLNVGVPPSQWPSSRWRASNLAPQPSLATPLPDDRSLANRAFTPRRVEGMRVRIQAIVDELFERIGGRRDVDVIADLAYQLPVIVISEMLSLPRIDIALFKRWSDDVIAYSAGAIGMEERARTSVTELLGYFNELVARLRRQPDNTIMSALVEVESAGSRLDGEELLAY